MSDTTNDPLEPADPPETVPPPSAPQTDSDTDSTTVVNPADVPETQPPRK